MVNTIGPLQYFPISRVLPDPNDTATYYVQAIIRNASTNATIDTINLNSQGNRIFSKLWRSPALASSQPLFITITTRVFSDAGYATPSTVYGDDQDTYQIYDMTNQTITSAHQIAAIVASQVGSGGDVDYKKIAKLLKPLEQLMLALQAKLDEEEDAPEPIKFPEPVDMTPIIDGITRIERKVNVHTKSLEEIKGKEVDLSPVTETLKEVRGHVEAIRGKPDTEVQIAPILEAIDELRADRTLEDKMDEMHGSIKALPDHTDRIEDLHDKFDDSENAGKNALDVIDGIHELINRPNAIGARKVPKPEKKETESKPKEQKPIVVRTMGGKLVERTPA